MIDGRNDATVESESSLVMMMMMTVRTIEKETSPIRYDHFLASRKNNVSTQESTVEINIFTSSTTITKTARHPECEPKHSGCSCYS